ncbi:unnamed protein product [Rotaria magnacalcarata]
MIIENNFDYNHDQYQQTVEFISHWLSLSDENDYQLYECDTQKHLWLLAHVYTTLEYEQTDLFSMYSACRVIHQLNSIKSPFSDLFVNQATNRSDLRGTFFRSIFDLLWTNLRQPSSDNENYQTWIHTYTFISKYYPSEKVLQGIQLQKVRCQIELMNLAYLIFLNENIVEPQELVTKLLTGIQLSARSDWVTLLPKIMETINQFIQEKNLKNLALMIDVQQWIMSILKSLTQPSEQVLQSLLSYLNQSANRISLAMKQFLFDQLIDFLLQRKSSNKSVVDLWDRFDLIPFLVECISDADYLEHHRISFHPSAFVADDNTETKIPLFDLFFFHLRAQMKHDSVTPKLLHKGILLKLPKISNEKKSPMADNLFTQLKNYFMSVLMALLLCRQDFISDDENEVLNMFSTMIQDILFVDSTAVNLSSYLQLFLSTIISKHSWHYLFYLLQSERLRTINENWSTTLCRLLQLDQTQCQNSHLQLSHQIQFTFSLNANNSSIFPTLHRSYEELRKIMDICVQSQNDEDPWKSLVSWMHDQLYSEETKLKINELKAMLLLKIYYDHYCTNQLEPIRPLINIIPRILSLTRGEERVFRALCDPEQNIVGYHSHEDTNALNDLFQLNCQAEFELNLRHLMVNLMAMILLAGQQSFLWTFAFEPWSLEDTYGFGSVYPSLIQADGVHYDCGCIISENGNLEHFFGGEYDPILNVPAVYVAYFATFGALAWHLLLYNKSVENLHGPILSPPAIGDTEPVHHLAGQHIRAKTCHFVFARLLSTFSFLSLRLSVEDSCILMSRCFERMAFLTVNEEEWIQPIYKRIDDKLNADEAFQNDVFYFVFDNLTEYKADINQRILQSQIQSNLQNFIGQMPLILEFQHFRIALHRSHTQASLSLRLLRFILDSFDILKVTKLITPLTRFYLLLHQTYTQLIKEDELFTISLEELHERAEKRFHQFYDAYHQNEEENHRTTINNGIEAINNYHQFAHGLIRPGACDQTQRFEKIEFQTPVYYLLTLDNVDEGNIIMRILSILIDYHNHVLKLLRNELNNNKNYSNSILKLLVDEITSKEVSILQVANYDIGIMRLNKIDCEWIERLCLASLTTNEEEAFINLNSSFTFNFEYTQSQIIRTYLLLCRINYQHIVQKFQCYTQPLPADAARTGDENLDLDEKYLIPLLGEQLEHERNYLKAVSLDNLYYAHTLLKQIAVTLKTYPDNAVCYLSLFSFVRTTDQDNDVLERIQQYKIKDFPLCHLNHIITLYADLINGFEHLFTDVSPLLRIQIEPQLNAKCIEQFDELIIHSEIDNDVDKIQAIIHTITQLLNDLKKSKDLMLHQSSQSFIEICQHLAIENPIVALIPAEIRCENYVPLNIHLVRIRSILQEKKVNIEEKTVKLWREQASEQEETDESNFQPDSFQNDALEITEIEGVDYQSVPPSPSITEEKPVDGNDSILPRSSSPRQETVDDNFEQPLVYSSLYKFDIRLVPCSSLNFLQKLHQYRTEPAAEGLAATKAHKFVVTHPDGTTKGFVFKTDKFRERVRKIFDDHHYDHDQYALVDKNELLFDFNKEEFQSSQISCLEYRIVERKHLVCVKFQYQSSAVEYLTTSKNQMAIIIQHFIDINQLKGMATEQCLYFCDQYGACIDDFSLEDLYENREKPVTVIVKELTSVNDILYEIHVTNTENFHRTVFFHSEATLQQIELWLKALSQKNNFPIDNYAFFCPKQQMILEKSQTISSIIDSTQSNTIEVISDQVITSVTLSYENNSHTLHVLKSMKIIALLENENLRQTLGIVDVVLENYTVRLEKTNDPITLSQDEMQQSIDTYCNAENESLKVRLFIPTSITIYHNEKELSIILSTKNITIREVLQLTDELANTRQCLALKGTKRVLDNNEVVSNLCEKEFLLIDKKDICHVYVDVPETRSNLCFVNHATIADVCKEQQINLENQYLVYSNEIIPSTATPLTCFLSETPIRFSVTQTSLPVTVTVVNDQQQKSIHFKCAHSMILKRLCSMSCHFFGVLESTAELKLADASDIDYDLSLMDIDEIMTEMELQLIHPPCLSCSITCSDHTIVLPCQPDKLMSSLISKIFEILSIAFGQMDSYELFALNDEETSIDFDASVDDIKELFSSSPSSIIAVEVKKK